MPNYVYSGISVSSPLTKKQEEIIEQIEKVGSICNYYKPRPEELSDICFGFATINGEKVKNWRTRKIGDEFVNVAVTPEELIILKEKYGYTNWYNWSLDNWNTKWGDCQLHIENNSISCELRYETAWSPICNTIIEMFAQDFPNFRYWFEEECEWGSEIEYIDGECVHEFSYDEPCWREEEEIKIEGLSVYASFLEEEHPSYGDGVGYYEDYCRDQFLGKTIEEAIDTLEKCVKEAKERQKNKLLTL